MSRMTIKRTIHAPVDLVSRPDAVKAYCER